MKSESPPDQQAVIRWGRDYESRNTEMTAFVSVGEFTFAPSPDGRRGIPGAIKHFAKIVNDHQPEYTVTLTESGGKVGHYRHAKLKADVFSIVRGNQTWVLSIAYRDLKYTEIAARIIESAQLVE
jgi:hypothetical protein